MKSAAPHSSEELRRLLGAARTASVPPPLVLGLRGSPLEAPENTRASLKRALELDLDGIAYDVRACASGEAVLLRDETLERTTDGSGHLSERALPDISRLDAGSWFAARFREEPLVLLEEALELTDPARPVAPGSRRGRRRREERSPVHLLLLRERGLVPEVARLVRGGARTCVRVASNARETCLEARDAGLRTMLLVHRASEATRAFVNAERIDACAVERGRWGGEAAAREWRCERWSIGVDDPKELLEACRLPQWGIATREPVRALSIRALAALAPAGLDRYPLTVPELEVIPGEMTGGRGDWCGSWSCRASVRNPFDHDAEVTLGLAPRHGAFETDGLPRKLSLAAGAESPVDFRLTGGSWSPGGDPLLFALYRWKSAAHARAGSLLLDAPLARVRTQVADVLPRRLTLLRETPLEPDASMVLARRGRYVYVRIENAGGLDEPRTLVHLDGRFVHGARGVRALLPEDFDARRDGVPFSCGFVGVRAGEDPAHGGERVVRRWAGGVPDQDGVGAPGRLFPAARA